VKFTQQGEISITIGVKEKKSHHVTLHFCISDTGIGITHEQQSMLFKPFSQIDDSNVRQFEGTGLGLTISKNLTEMMGGAIWVESEPDKGSSFHFTITFKIGNDSQIEKVATENKNTEIMQKKLQGRKILLVEDNEINQELAINILEEMGINLSIANNGQEALDKLETENFDGILMDIQMPVMDGYTATREIRKQDRFKNLPIIAMTANVMKSDLDKATEVGMNAHIGKPFKMDEIVKILGKWFSPT
jgi:two-component system, sensor histidine kinase and response regulator